jgi:hypothetical protein
VQDGERNVVLTDSYQITENYEISAMAKGLVSTISVTVTPGLKRKIQHRGGTQQGKSAFEKKTKTKKERSP